jgi:hypothetical protein
MVTAQQLHLDVLLDLVAVKLELTPTQYQDAVRKYGAVGAWLSAPGTLLASLSPDIYPQGSLRLQTTVRPRSHEEYDLDIVCQLALDPRSVLPAEVYQALGRRLRENALYAPILEQKNRCWRLNYAGQFHMDVLPACPDPTEPGTAVVVPDREAACWKASNPKGFATWFDSRKVVVKALERAAAMEPLPLPKEVLEKSPLQRGVQLIKRQRDQAFADDALVPASIVLTTLAAEAYEGQAWTSEAVSRYLMDVAQRIEASGGVPFRVVNPTNPAELLSERWESTPGAYKEFCRQLRIFEGLWMDLLKAQTLHQMSALLMRLFGEDVTNKAVGEYSSLLAKARQGGSVGTRAGGPGLVFGTGPGIKRVLPNTNYGDPEA